MSDLVGIALVVTGMILMVLGAALAVYEQVAKRGLASIPDLPWDKILAAIGAIIEAFSKLRASSALLVIGVFCVVAGCVIAVVEPF